MFLHGVAQFTIVIFVLIFGLVTVALFGVIAFALTKLQQQLEKLTAKLEPVIVKTTDTLETVQRVTMTVGEKTDQILTRGEALTENVTGKVEKTATVVQSAVTGPLIGLSSLIAGFSKGVSVYADRTAHPVDSNGNGTHGKIHST